METTLKDPPRKLPRPGGQELAYRKLDGGTPGVVFLCGYMSDMLGAKATCLEQHCRQAGRSFVRFDYQGTGESSGEFSDVTIGLWTEDTLAVLDACTAGPQILVGSSMGGWIMLLAALARPERVAALAGVAAAPDFTEDLIWNRLGALEREELDRLGYCRLPDEGGESRPVTKVLIEDGRNRLLLRRRIPIHCPVTLIHGMKDVAVPWMTSARIAEQLLSDDVQMLLIKDGDHRLSRDQDLTRLELVVDDLALKVEK